MEYDSMQVNKSGAFSYPIIFREDFSSLSPELTSLGLSGRKLCIVTDSNVAPLYLEALFNSLEGCAKTLTSYILPAGELNKSLEQIQKIYEHLILNHFDRKDLLVALGGGVTGDMTGFAAATYLRGIDFIQIPTTLLAQVDSSIGGKTGVDFLQYKNMVGAFHQPQMVYMNISTLQTLPDEQFACGMGEIIKHGFIRDASYLSWLKEKREAILTRNPGILKEMIFRSCIIKKTVVEQDPKEQGERAVLNMGHTVGHAIEKLKQFTLLHGQCVSVGTAASAYLSMKRGLLSSQEYQTALSMLQSFHLPVKTNGLQAEEVLTATKSDKKMEQGKIKFILMEYPGYAYVDTTVSDEELLEAIASVLTN